MSDVGMEVNYGQMDQGAQELNTGSQQIKHGRRAQAHAVRVDR